MKENSNYRLRQYSLKGEIFIIVFLFTTIYLFSCLISYSPNDTRAIRLVDGQINNFGGRLGVVLSSFLIDLFGLYSFLLILFCFILFMIIVLQKLGRYLIKYSLFLILSGLIIPALFELIKPNVIIHNFTIRSGGIIGENIKNLLVQYFNEIPSIIILLLLLFIIVFGIFRSISQQIMDSSSKKNRLRLVQKNHPKIDSKKPITDICDISSHELFEDALIENEELVLSKKRTIRRNYSNEALAINVNEEMIKKVLAKLISNAVKYSSKGDILCTLRNVGNRWAEFSISDCGKGIKYSRQLELFLLDQKDNNSNDRNVKKSDFCLGMCKEIIEAHGGEIWVESELGSGSRFVILLPTLSV